MKKESVITEAINVQGTEITIISSIDKEDYISLTDIAKYRNSDDPNAVIGNWMRNRSTIEFLGLWEMMNNNDFNPIEFEGFKNSSGGNSFTLSPQKWITTTNAIGIISKSGRYGGTFAHTDIAFEFASWISPEFKLYIIKDYQRLKESETHQSALEWNVKRILAKANYKLHTDAIKENLIPPKLTSKQQGFIYADEADMLNMCLFGKTAGQWRKENPDKKGNIRDYATIEQLLILTNLENANAIYIQQGLTQQQRLKALRQLVISQLNLLSRSKSVSELETLHNQVNFKSIE